MGRMLFLLGVFSLLVGCSNDQPDWSFSPPPDQKAIDEKAHAAFLQKLVVQEFIAEGIPLDCELSICGKITDASLNVLKKFKREFSQRKDRIKEITLVKEDYPIYDYRLEGAYIPADLTEATLNEFFEVLSSIHAFESEVGFRIEFPNNRHLKKSIQPLLEILKSNASALKADAHRYELLVISSVYNQFFPGDKVLMLKIEDLRKSFTDQWAFMSTFFKAQDLFGDVHFDFDIGDASGLNAMAVMFNNSSAYAPLFSKLQGRRIALFTWEYRMYSDAHAFLMDLGVSSSFDEKYLLDVLRDQIHIVDLSNYIGKRIDHSNGVIELEVHDECLSKIETLKTNIKNKVHAISKIEVASGQYVPDDNSSFLQGKLYLNCNQSTEDLQTIIDGIQ